MNIILLGPQGSGKGTQAEKLSEEFGLFHFEAGALMRELAKTHPDIEEIVNKRGALMPDDQIIKKGQQIGLMIFSSDKEFTLHPKPGTELTIDLDGTTLTLPIVGGVNEFNNSVK